MSTDILLSSRQMRRKRFFLKAVLVFAILFLALVGIAGFFYIPKFRIKEISIEGANVLNKEEFKTEIAGFLKQKLWKILPADNVFIFSGEQMAAGFLPEFPILKKVSFRRDFSQTLSVFVEERKPVALWCKDFTPLAATTSIQEEFPKEFGLLQKIECVFIDETGFIFQLAPNFSGGIFPKFFDNRQQSASTSASLGGAASDISAAIGSTAIGADEFRNLRSFSELLSKKGFNVGKIILKDGRIYEVHLKEGWYILLNEKNEAGQSFANLELVLDGTIKEKQPRLEYIDLRFGKKVFYKLK